MKRLEVVIRNLYKNNLLVQLWALDAIHNEILELVV